MAGESPDRAEQQGSSEGRTPSVSSTVASSESPAPAVPAPAPVDQPTAVFKTLAPRVPEDHAAEESIPETEAETAPEAKAASEADADVAAAPEGDRLKQAVAAWVATASKGGEAAEASAEAEESASAPSGAEEPSEAADVAGAAEAADEPVEAPGAAPRVPKAEAPSWFAKKPAEPEAQAFGSAPATSGAAGPEASKPAPAAPEAPKPDAPTSDAPTSDAPKADAPKAEVPKPASPEPGAPKAAVAKPVASEGPVDQPTTMFRAVRPPVVDQPTTALKLPRDVPGLGSDSERTSTFVPLRPDVPAEQKAEKPQAAATSKPQPKAQAPAPAPAPAPTPALAEAERTRQQPLPPLPPLDLLAELTNTPPPPPNAWRTTLRRFRIWTPLVLLLLIVFAIVQMARPLPAPALKLSGPPTYTFAGGPLKMPWPGEGQGAVEVEGVGSMGTYGAQKPAPIASVTKTMTAYVILRDHPLKGKQKGPEITVDQKAADQAKAAHESTAPVKKGQVYTEKELLQLLMIPSANNVARLLARWDAGSEQAFVDKMNAAAKELGMTQSRYTDPSGLLDSTISTPQDQLKLAKAVMKFDVFREIVDMPNATIEGVGYIENNNSRLLLKAGVTGIKTGSSTPAGGNLLWSANTVVDGRIHRVLGIVMGAQNAATLNKKLELSLDYSYELIKKAQDDVTSAAVVKKGQVVGYVDDGLGGQTPVVATKEIKAVGWPGLKVEVELTDGGKSVPHSGRAGDVVGTVSIGEGAGRISAPVALKSDLVEPGFDKKLTRVG
ncbi:D-alanyl-D-alanine carboxypeptidase [Streptomyces sp. R302]|uniref:serine hydrolase n=1 Tax=unclassified Streptomyces TaxID=2593676 RepID=UPI00145DE5AB|nr:D-alanyl-D-alanine carboxypeptidase [Streptomyces sp. R301]NML83538.1 D-alanyl-D-alanine carboxypeptidase [Streptomyces sp. R302]